MEKFYRENKNLVLGMGVLVMGSIIIYLFLKKKCDHEVSTTQAKIKELTDAMQQNKIKLADLDLDTVGLRETSPTYVSLIKEIDKLEMENVNISEAIKINEKQLRSLWCD